MITPQEAAYTYMRIASIQLFGDYLCGMETPYLRFSGRTRLFESLIEVDDVEGCPGLKLGAVQEAAFHASLAKFMSRLVELGIEEEARQVNNQDDEEDSLSRKDGKMKKAMKSSKNLQLKITILNKDGVEGRKVFEIEDGKDIDDDENEEDDDEYKDEEEAIEEMNQLGVCSVERRKLLQYRQLVKNCPQKARYFKLMEVSFDKMILL